MNVLYEIEDCKLIKHDRQLCCFHSDDGEVITYQLQQILFENFKRKQKKSFKEPEAENETKTRVLNFLTACKTRNFFPRVEEENMERLKAANIELLNKFQAISYELGSFHGENNLNYGKCVTMKESSFLIPPHSRFFNKKVEELETCIPPNEANKFDFIVIDPPWKNRYIKRLKKNDADKKRGYFMMTDDDIIQIPLEKYSKITSIVVIWCTNSETHLNAVKQKFLVKWKLKLLSSWLWIKIDKNGELFNPFEGNKKPFEQLFIATHQDNSDYDRQLENDCLLFSEPSSIHSHKPPLLGKQLTSCNRFTKALKTVFIFNRHFPAASACATDLPRSLCEKSLRELHVNRLRSFETTERRFV